MFKVFCDCFGIPASTSQRGLGILHAASVSPWHICHYLFILSSLNVTLERSRLGVSLFENIILKIWIIIIIPDLFNLISPCSSSLAICSNLSIPNSYLLSVQMFCSPALNLWHSSWGMSTSVLQVTLSASGTSFFPVTATNNSKKKLIRRKWLKIHRESSKKNTNVSAPKQVRKRWWRTTHGDGI